MLFNTAYLNTETSLLWTQNRCISLETYNFAVGNNVLVKRNRDGTLNRKLAGVREKSRLSSLSTNVSCHCHIRYKLDSPQTCDWWNEGKWWLIYNPLTLFQPNTYTSRLIALELIGRCIFSKSITTFFFFTIQRNWRVIWRFRIFVTTLPWFQWTLHFHFNFNGDRLCRDWVIEKMVERDEFKSEGQLNDSLHYLYIYWTNIICNCKVGNHLLLRWTDSKCLKLNSSSDLSVAIYGLQEHVQLASHSLHTSHHTLIQAFNISITSLWNH